MERVVKTILRIKKEFLVAIVVLVGSGYFFLLQPSSPVKVDWNKFQLGKRPSALRIEGPDTVSGVGKKFTVEVKVDTNGYRVNAVQSYISFDPRVLEVVNTDTESSFCKFYPENNYSNSKGLIRLACGAPYPGFKGESPVQKIEFLAKSFATTKLKVEKESGVYANDGKGTNLIKEFEVKTVTIRTVL